MACGVINHGFAQVLQALVLRQAYPQLNHWRAADFVAQQGAQMGFALQQIGCQWLSLIAAGVHFYDQCPQQGRGFQHAALLPDGIVHPACLHAATTGFGQKVQRVQACRFHQRHRVLHSGWHPHGTVRWHKIGGIGQGHAYDPARRNCQLRPGVAVRHDQGVFVQLAHLGAHRPLRMRLIEHGVEQRNCRSGACMAVWIAAGGGGLRHGLELADMRDLLADYRIPAAVALTMMRGMTTASMTSATPPVRSDIRTISLVGLAHGSSHFFTCCCRRCFRG